MSSRIIAKLLILLLAIGFLLVQSPRVTSAQAVPISASQFYDFEVVATTNQAGLTNIFDKVSINDFGNIAFSGQVSGGESVFVWSKFNTSTSLPITPALTNITPGLIRSAVTFAAPLLYQSKP